MEILELEKKNKEIIKLQENIFDNMSKILKEYTEKINKYEKKIILLEKENNDLKNKLKPNVIASNDYVLKIEKLENKIIELEAELEYADYGFFNMNKKQTKATDNIELDILKTEVTKLEAMFMKENNNNLTKKIRSNKKDYKIEVFDNIANSQALSNLTEKDLKNILLVSVFYGYYEKLINSSSVFLKIKTDNSDEYKFINSLHSEGKVQLGAKVSEPIKVILEKNIKIINFINTTIKDKVLNIIELIFNSQLIKAYSIEKGSIRCVRDKRVLVARAKYIKYKGQNEEFYILTNVDYCVLCKSCYVNIKNIKKAVNKNNGVKPDIKICTLKPIEEITHRTTMIRPEVQHKNKLYEGLINSFKGDHLGNALLAYNSILRNTDIIKSLTTRELITTAFIGYLIKGNITSSDIIFNYVNHGSTIETVIYNKIKYGLAYYDLLYSDKQSINYLDQRVSSIIIDKLLTLDKKNTKKPNALINNTESDMSNLSAESVIKKLGYSTSLGRESRWNILKDKVVPQVGKKKTISHLNFLIRMNQNRNVMQNAVTEWRYDVSMLERQL